MRKALQLMEAEADVMRRQGHGTFVNDQASGELVTRFDNIRAADGEHINAEVKAGAISQSTANELECARLSLRSSDGVHRIQRVHFHNDRPFLVDETAMPADLFPGLAESNHVPHRIAVLAAKYGILLGKAQEHISMGVAGTSIAAALNLGAASTVLILDRVVFALDGRPIQWRLSYCHFVDEYYLATMA